MRLQLKNIGKLAEADVELKGITVIGGENDTGKSTVGKVLFSVFNGFYDVENKIEKDRIYSIFHSLQKSISHPFQSFIVKESKNYKIAKRIFSNAENYKENHQLLKTEVEQLFPDANPEEISQATKNIIFNLEISNHFLYRKHIQNQLNTEFDGQICRMPYEATPSSVELTIQKQTLSVQLLADIVTDIEFPMILNTEALYIDDPFVLDCLMLDDAYMHRAHLVSKLLMRNNQDNVVESAIADEKMKCILEKINLACNGRIIQDGGELFYQLPSNSSPLSMKNVSTGIKMFAIIKRLIENGALGFNSTLILDEPEIHVHPKWQLVFAEIIVLLQKEFDMHILLNTHSPYFLEAIEVYSKKHGIEEKCRYYLSENTEDGSVIRDVTDCTGKIYKKLAEPFQTLENVRYEDA